MPSLYCMPALVSDQQEPPFEDVLDDIHGLRLLCSFPVHRTSAGVPAETAAEYHEGGMRGQGAMIQSDKDQETRSEAVRPPEVRDARV
jgi:hypothetical protein